VRELLETHPEMILVIKHVSDWRTVRFIRQMRDKGFHVYGEICAHYLFLCHEDLYEGANNVGTAFNANCLCWPIYKDEKSMMALREAAASGEDGFFYGSDWAAHTDDPTKDKNVKITEDGVVCGGVAIIPAVGLSRLIDLFIEMGKLENLSIFLSRNARKVHGWLPANKTVKFVREDWTVPALLVGDGPDGPIKVKPFMRGETCHWKLAA
jgi:dihydroorotase